MLAPPALLGPTFLEGLTISLLDRAAVATHEWKRQLRSSSGGTTFQIRYYGQRHAEHRTLVVATDFAPAAVWAVDVTTREEILLFDGCTHGYNALFCDTYTAEQVQTRRAQHFYCDADGEDTFQVLLSTFNGFDYDEEFGKEVDEEGFVTLLNGRKMKLEEVKRNGYDGLQIIVTNKLDHLTTIRFHVLARTEIRQSTVYLLFMNLSYQLSIRSGRRRCFW
ncbi:hypothetical protein [uncultured Hymenobacter sp.]|uniref:hypothetical protein n=1 Tax=uncultured Hymenobacter sp. TaxID=170016 RepID=UPI0035C9D00C